MACRSVEGFRFPGSPPDANEYLVINDEGQIFMQREYSARTWFEHYVWIEAEHVPPFLESLGLPMYDPDDDKTRRRTQTKIFDTFKNIDAMTKWAEERGIPTQSWMESE